MKMLFIFGTRPEAIKMAPVIREAEKRRGVKVMTCVTAQHRGMLDQVLGTFDIRPDHDLNIMKKDQDLFDIVSGCLEGFKRLFKQLSPDIVMVQGDTTTAFAAGLASYYSGIPLAHIEAGLRTYDKMSPFPEELNRHLLGVLADYHFAPTEWAKSNLVKEGVPRNRIWVTGNTAIDALMMIRKSQKTKAAETAYERRFKKISGLDLSGKVGRRRMILVTGHRRENFGERFRDICLALKEIAEKRPDAVIVYPVHLNPNVRGPARSILSGVANIYLLEPLDYGIFVYLMGKSHIILTDSGGIQEEAPALGKPVLLMRDKTERPEGIQCGTVRMVGTDRKRIVKEALRLMDDARQYRKMSMTANPYGTGDAAKKIMDIITRRCGTLKR